MQPINSSDQIGFADSDDYQRAREVFENAGYSEAGFSQYMGTSSPTTPIALDLPNLVMPAKGGSHLETLMRLFMLCLPAEIRVIGDALHPMSLELGPRPDCSPRPPTV